MLLHVDVTVGMSFIDSVTTGGCERGLGFSLIMLPYIVWMWEYPSLTVLLQVGILVEVSSIVFNIMASQEGVNVEVSFTLLLQQYKKV